MRFIVYGVGAVGGTIAARLALAGIEVAGIARGGMLDAIRARGLTLVSAEGRQEVTFPCHADPSEVGLRPDDVIILTMKSQDTEAALERLLAAGATSQAIVCAQNGVANERMALRRFANVYGITVMLPAQYLKAGEVVCFGAPRPGLFDLGRYPSGTDETAERIGAALGKAGFGVEVTPDVMRFKYGKLIINLNNGLGAAFGGETREGRWYKAAKAEGDAVLEAAGIAQEDVGFDNPRRIEMKVSKVPGIDHIGSSSQQSIARGAGSIETDWLNGEIVLLGRLHGIPVPVNAAICAAARQMLARGMPLGNFPETEFEALVAAQG